jgi:hypothetical protein
MPGPKYPLLVVLPGGRVAHNAKPIGDGTRVSTPCHKSGVPTDTDPRSVPPCAACVKRPNPIDQRSYLTEA